MKAFKLPVSFSIKGLNITGSLTTKALTLTCEELGKEAVITDMDTVATIVSFGCNQKMQNNYAGNLPQYKEKIEEAFDLWSEGYFTLVEKQRAERPATTSTKSGRVSGSRLVELILEASPTEQHDALKSVKAHVLIKAYGDKYPEELVSMKETIKQEAEADEAKAMEEVSKLFG